MATDPDDMWRGTVGILLIVVFLAILGGIVYLLYGPGITITVPRFFGDIVATSTFQGTSAEVSLSEQFLARQEGQRFNCDDRKALKVVFTETNVQLSLSDGRALILSQTVAASGEMQYRNTDGTFVFRNIGNQVSVVENSIATYNDCVAA